MHLPLTLKTEASDSAPEHLDALGWGALEGLTTARPGLELDSAWCEKRRFRAKPGEALVSAGEGGTVQVVVGLGVASGVTAQRLRQAAAGFARSTGGAKALALDLTGIASLGVPAELAVAAAIEGFWGARYRYERYHAGDPDPLESLTIIVAPDDLAFARRGLERGRAIADATWLARDLSNDPAGALTPVRLAEVAIEIAEREGLEAQILDEEAIREARLGGLLGVAAGSAEPPRLIKLVYVPAPGQARKRSDGSIPTVVLVGKGITFDSGGLTLKNLDGMMTMKTDMSGAADVIATIGACRALGVGIRVVAIAPTTENMPGGKAVKPGDVLEIRNGKTIEVLNTDCEGRLVLADGLSLAVEEEPDAIVDLATLTGACTVALGLKIAGLMGNDDRLVSALQAASARAGEPTWLLPLPEAYRPDIDSEVADMKNMSKRGAGALIAGLLLQEFVADRPWAHLDIAGPSRSDEDSGELRKGSTGFGVRTLLEFLCTYEPLSSPAAGAAGGKVIP
ncbi:MAG: leucyl aminopeptidase [Acidimicrobiales bacterium]